MAEDLYRGDGEEFLTFCKVTPDRNATLADKVAALKAHLAPFTPEWAEGITGVPPAEWTFPERVESVFLIMRLLP